MLLNVLLRMYCYMIIEYDRYVMISYDWSNKILQTDL